MEFLFETIATTTTSRISYNLHVQKKLFEKLFQQCQKDSSAKNDYCYARSNECHASRVCVPILMEYFLYLTDLFLLNTEIQNTF